MGSGRNGEVREEFVEARKNIMRNWGPRVSSLSRESLLVVRWTIVLVIGARVYGKQYQNGR